MTAALRKVGFLMGRRRKIVTERLAEAKSGKKTFMLSIPTVLKPIKEEQPIPEKTSLYVPTELLISEKSGFVQSSFSPDVFITRNVPEVLKIIFKYGDIAKRYGENSLENDPSRQQIIIYTMVTCQENLLWNQRSSPNKKGKKFIGDPRLQGRYAVGFGGHKTREDIVLSREELIFLRDLLPAIQDETGTMLGLKRGFFSEVEEEIGILRENIQDLKLLGAFYDKRIEDPILPVQVGWVHTGIAAVLEVDPRTTNQLLFRSSEIAKAWWIPFGRVEEELEKRQNDWIKGRGPKVETWTEIMIKEFWKDYISSAGV